MPNLNHYADADAWIESNRTMLESTHPGQYLYMDACTRNYVAGHDHDACGRTWKQSHPVTPPAGWRILGVQL